MARQPMPVLKTVYCPRCDKPFTDFTRLAALSAALKHIKLAHPEYIPLLEEEDDKA